MTVALQNEKLDFEYFIQLALSHIKDLRAKTVNIADSIKKGEYEHSNVSINAKIKAPILILPSDLYDKDSFQLRFDLGEVSITSDLQNYQKGFNYKAVTEEADIFDIYKIGISGLCLKLSKPDSNFLILDDVSAKLSLCPCLEPLHPVFPSFKAEIDFPNKIKLNSNWDTIRKILNLKNKLLISLENSIYLKVATLFL